MPKTKLKPAISLAEPERLETLLKETEEELLKIQPRLDELEKINEELRNLKQAKQRLLTLKMSLSTLIETTTKPNVTPSNEIDYEKLETKLLNFSELSASKDFHPDKAFEEADKILRQKNSLNYEMFKAVVYYGGKATTEEIKAFLIESGTRQPQTGETFDEAPLTEISSRANYLVRKGLLQPLERGSFYTTVGWVTPG